MFHLCKNCNYSGHPSPHIRISNTLCSFSPLTRLKMLIGGGEPYEDLNVWKSKPLTCKHDDLLISIHWSWIVTFFHKLFIYSTCLRKINFVGKNLLVIKRRNLRMRQCVYAKTVETHGRYKRKKERHSQEVSQGVPFLQLYYIENKFLLFLWGI